MSAVVFSQTYPVQTFVQISPPHTSYLLDYANPTSNQMKIFLTLTDFSVPSYQVKLKFTFTGNGYTISTSSLLSLPIITLTPGVPLEISGNDLMPYLLSQNLIFNGVDVGYYELHKILPEGPCQICVEVIDFLNPNQINLAGPNACSQVWFSLNDPPLLNTPFCGSQISVTDPQQIVFSWSPLHMNSIHSSGTLYTFELYEIRPEGADPNQVVNSTLPIFIQTIDQPLINYGITEPPLQVGMSYAWRVKAHDIDGRDFFRNNGYSSVCTFTYGNIASSLADGIVLNLNTNGTGSTFGTAFWNGSSTFDGYKLELRKTGNPDYQWFPYTTLDSELKIYSLEPSTEYECRVQGLIGDDYESEWSNVATFTTQPVSNYNCGTTTLPAGEQNYTPLKNAIAGMTFTIGQFDMMVTNIQPVTPGLQNGHYKGTGKIAVAFLYNIRVSFEDILVDDNLLVRSGKVEAISEGIDEWLTNFLPEPDFIVDGGIENFQWNDSTSLTVYVDGIPQTFQFPENGQLVIQDGDGMLYIFNADGSFEIISTLLYSDDVLAGNKDYRVNFEKSPNQIYGFDKKKYGAWVHDYDVILLQDSTNYFVPFKSIAPNEEDVVIAHVISPNTLTDISFVALVNGQEIPLSNQSINDSTYQVTIDGLTESAFVYAKHNGNRIGKLWVRVLPKIEKEIVIVPVNGANLTNQNNLEASINEIFIQANVEVNVTIAENFQSTTWDLNADGKLQNGDVNLMSHYSEEMRTLRDEYFAQDSSNHTDKYYLFIIPEFYETELAGYMVRGKSVGFLKAGENAITAAHELAHGIFALEHTFPAVAQGTTQNLMDYSASTHLREKQWYRIHQPLPAWSILDDEEEGELSSEINFDLISEEVLQEINQISISLYCSQSFFSIYQQKITIPADYTLYIIKYYFDNGLLKGFWLSGHPSKLDGYYAIAKGTASSEIIKQGQIYQTESLSGTSVFIRYEDLNNECPLVIDPLKESGCVRYEVILEDNSKRILYKKVPENYKIQAIGEQCNSGDIVISGVANNIATCRTIDSVDCQNSNGEGGGNISPNDFVKLIELSNDPVYGSNNYSWLNAQGEAVITVHFSEMHVADKLLAFTKNGISYVGITVHKSGEDRMFAYVEKAGFNQIKNEKNGAVQYKDIQHILYDEFIIANTGEIIHYRVYDEYQGCVSFREYEIVHDGRSKYQTKSNPSGSYYFEEADGVIVLNKSCGAEILSIALCDALSMGAEGIGMMVDYLFSVALIPPKYWDPTLGSQYDPTAYNVFAAVSTLVDFGTLPTVSKQIGFAFFCGLLNGIVTEIGGIGQAMAMFSQMICDAELRAQIWQALTNISETIAQVTSAFSDGWQTSNEYQRGEISGRTTIAILSIVIPITKIKWANIVKKGVNFVKVVSKEFLTFIKKVKDNLLPGFKIIGDDIRNLYYYATNGPSYSLASISEDGTLTLTNSNRWFDSFDVDDVVDDLGDCNYKIGESGPVENDDLVLIKKNESEVGFGKKNIPDSPLSFLDDLDWIPELKQQLINDLESTPSLIQKFSDVPYAKKIELAEAWKSLHSIGVDDVVRRNPDYLKNIDDYSKRSGKSTDEIASAANNNENGIEQFLDELEDTPASGHWDKDPFQRGRDIEDVLGQNLPETFKTIDKYDDATGEATSIKSIDLDAKTYQIPSKLRYRLNKYLDELDKFDGYELEGVIIGDIENPIISKTLEIAIPRAATGDQLNVLNEIISNGVNKGINVKIIIVP